MPTDPETTEAESMAEAAAEAVAEAWASIDGKLDRFRANRADRSLDRTDGSYPGYMEDARSMIARLAARGFVVLPADAVGIGRAGEEVW